ncbi:hypothetical protein V6C32_10760 [Desulforamulus ruminis]
MEAKGLLDLMHLAAGLVVSSIILLSGICIIIFDIIIIIKEEIYCWRWLNKIKKLRSE